MENKRNLIYSGAALAAAALLVGLDQWTKHLAVVHLKGKPSVVLADGVMELTYLENRGAAFGLLQGQQWLFYILTAVFVALVCWAVWRMPKTRRFMPLYAVFIVLTAGALGNFIDRVVHQYVVDFFSFVLIHFPIFNVADIYVTLSAAAFFILILFYYKDEDYHVFFPSKGR